MEDKTKKKVNRIIAVEFVILALYSAILLVMTILQKKTGANCISSRLDSIIRFIYSMLCILFGTHSNILSLKYLETDDLVLHLRMYLVLMLAVGISFALIDFL